MKKRLLWLLLLVFVIVSAVYFFFPPDYTIRAATSVSVNARAFRRVFPDDTKWIHWWPEAQPATASSASKPRYHLNNATYTVVEKRLTSLVMLVKEGTDSLLTELFFIPLTDDSISLTWEVNANSTKEIGYGKAKKWHKGFTSVLQSIQRYYGEDENLYGITIRKARVKDSILIATSTSTQGYPATETVYGLIKRLALYAAKNKSFQTGMPMVNVNTTDSITYTTQVALPLDKMLSDSGSIVYRRMLGGGDILFTDVRGGVNSISLAYKEMEHYVSDFRRTAPAIPFLSLVTDRSKEPDTSKWVTRIYWPVM
ncbi:MAG: hypothetical protein WKF70_04190 [Chitinophagaceae bacterium]